MIKEKITLIDFLNKYPIHGIKFMENHKISVRSSARWRNNKRNICPLSRKALEVFIHDLGEKLQNIELIPYDTKKSK